GQLLEPGVVGEGAIVDSRIALEGYLDSFHAPCASGQERRQCGPPKGGGEPPEAGIGCEAASDCLLPFVLLESAARALTPRRAQEPVRAPTALAVGGCEEREELIGRAAVVQRSYERLDERDGPIIGPRVVPRLQVV